LSKRLLLLEGERAARRAIMMFYPDSTSDSRLFDVVICGGGLAGLTLARQLRQNYPDLTIALVERTKRPLPVACLKVGESSVEVGTNYYTKVLQLQSYFAERHVPKLGLRFFFGDSQGPIENRPEVGGVRFPEVPSYQIDRGILENDLRQMVSDAGVKLVEDCAAKDVQLSENEEPHRVTVQQVGTQATEELRCRWLVDATGRRRLLQGKLGLKKENGHNASAAWFRMEGRVDIDDLVPRSQRAWHERVPGRIRYYSTNHLMGRGYWVWLIPLGSGNTSVGIVTSEKIHPVRTYNTYELAYQWLRKHEPRVARYLSHRQPMDFLSYKNYSYSSHQVLSSNRWMCVGEAGVFTDPFYSPGSDFICMGNTFVNDLVGIDYRGALDRDYVEDLNALYMSLNESYVDLYRDSYDIFGSTHVMATKILFDWAIYWAFFAQLCFQNILTRPDFLKRIFELGREYLDVNRKVQQLFRDWGTRAKSRDTFEFLDPLSVPYVLERHLDLTRPKTPEETLADIETHLKVFQEWADVLVAQAIRETDASVARELEPSSWFRSSSTRVDAKPFDGGTNGDRRTGILSPSRIEQELQAVLL
jgi:flavin-dependent dehydrogenase